MSKYEKTTPFAGELAGLDKISFWRADLAIVNAQIEALEAEAIPDDQEPPESLMQLIGEQNLILVEIESISRTSENDKKKYEELTNRLEEINKFLQIHPIYKEFDRKNKELQERENKLATLRQKKGKLEANINASEKKIKLL